MSPPRAKAWSTRTKAYVGYCRRCEASDVTIRSTYGLCVECYKSITLHGHGKWYPKIFTVSQVESLTKIERMLFWRSMRKILEYNVGRTCVSEWMGTDVAALREDLQTPETIVILIRLVGYVGLIFAQREDDTLESEHHLDDAHARKLVARVRSDAGLHRLAVAVAVWASATVEAHQRGANALCTPVKRTSAHSRSSLQRG